MTHPSVNSIVERKWTPEQFWEYLEAFVGEWEADTIKDAMEGFGLTVASATIISELQADRDRLYQANVEWARGNLHNTRDLIAMELRAREAESSLSRIKAETIEREGWKLVPIEPTPEALDALADECRATWGVNVKDRKPCPINFKHEWRERMRPIYKAAIRSLGSTGGAEKTAESEHSPSTPTTATE